MAMSANAAGSEAQPTFRSPWPDAELPVLPLVPFVLQRAQDLATKAAIVDGSTGRTLTYRDLEDGIHRVAFGLGQRGFGKGDVYAIYSSNCPEYALALLGVATLG